MVIYKKNLKSIWFKILTAASIVLVSNVEVVPERISLFLLFTLVVPVGSKVAVVSTVSVDVDDELEPIC